MFLLYGYKIKLNDLKVRNVEPYIVKRCDLTNITDPKSYLRKN